MGKIFYVDVPNPHGETDNDPWLNIATVKTREEAETLLEERYGINRIYARAFITEGEEANA